jgi:hypothetical protein
MAMKPMMIWLYSDWLQITSFSTVVEEVVRRQKSNENIFEARSLDHQKVEFRKPYYSATKK